MEIRINRDDKSDSVGCSSLLVWLNELMIENISSLHGQHITSGPTNFVISCCFLNPTANVK